MKTKDPKKVVIVGGGFGGLSAAKYLKSDSRFEITIVDKKNHHLFQPLLYQVATAGLSPADIAAPIRSVLSGQENIRVRLDSVTKVEPEKKTLSLMSEKLFYDYLILACGSSHSYFGKDEWEKFAPGLKTLADATDIRRRILLSFEEAEKESDPEKQKIWQTIVVVGGGPTGVELAGAIAEMSLYTLAKDFKTSDPTKTDIILIEAGPRVLPTFSEDLSQNATESLKSMGVQVRTNSRVTHITEEGVQMGDQFIKSQCVLWAAGVKPSPLNTQLGVELDRQGRIFVEKDLSLKKFPEIFVLGDQAHFKDSEGQPLPGLASVALQQGRHVARVLKSRVSGQEALGFHYVDKGQMATIGRKKAVAQTGKLKFKGGVAWLMWLFVHIYYLIGFKNRLFVLIQWVWSYFTYQRGARLIVEKD